MESVQGLLPALIILAITILKNFIDCNDIRCNFYLNSLLDSALSY